MLLDDVGARIEGEIPELARRVEGAAELARLVQQDSLPQQTPASFVLPLGFRGGAADAVTGLYRQGINRSIGVVLVVEAAGDATGAAALPKIHELEGQVIQALAGWEPPGQSFGVLVPVRGDLVSLAAGTVIYQLTFDLQEQLRIPR